MWVIPKLLRSRSARGQRGFSKAASLKHYAINAKTLPLQHTSYVERNKNQNLNILWQWQRVQGIDSHDYNVVRKHFNCWNLSGPPSQCSFVFAGACCIPVCLLTAIFSFQVHSLSQNSERALDHSYCFKSPTLTHNDQTGFKSKGDFFCSCIWWGLLPGNWPCHPLFFSAFSSATIISVNYQAIELMTVV